MPLQDLVTAEKPIPLFVEKCVEFIEDTGRIEVSLKDILEFNFCYTNSLSHVHDSLKLSVERCTFLIRLVLSINSGYNHLIFERSFVVGCNPFVGLLFNKWLSQMLKCELNGMWNNLIIKLYCLIIDSYNLNNLNVFNIF